MLKGVWKRHLVFIGSILRLRSGDSVIPAKLAEHGYQRRLCVSFSPVVVGVMTERQKEIEWIDWGRVSVRNMLLLIATGPVDVASDKGMLDTMIHGSPWSPHEGEGKYMQIPERGSWMDIFDRKRWL
ncbi:uncharacterized protein FPRO_12179 [Fusarium proliferatum ET1]|uniref:Uncharacterized protein n=1 Tax=Fusarium proliferatum (strain ET1) TaxID=1227346 RepID=A0A1L7W258_FUSPR|nr:uncharacterized protein FPRO_12179 [Fusarium proliferatum ET1]CZR46729.1 uncharacterized protein FPRO_12179 [Fusarium proliferatum ET1]